MRPFAALLIAASAIACAKTEHAPILANPCGDAADCGTNPIIGGGDSGSDASTSSDTSVDAGSIELFGSVRSLAAFPHDIYDPALPVTSVRTIRAPGVGGTIASTVSAADGSYTLSGLAPDALAWIQVGTVSGTKFTPQSIVGFSLLASPGVPTVLPVYDPTLTAALVTTDAGGTEGSSTIVVHVFDVSTSTPVPFAGVKGSLAAGTPPFYDDGKDDVLSSAFASTTGKRGTIVYVVDPKADASFTLTEGTRTFGPIHPLLAPNAVTYIRVAL